LMPIRRLKNTLGLALPPFSILRGKKRSAFEKKR